uniref:Hypotheticial protein n=1 Tax=Schistosoma japonicum TaxID=6182 RepID=C1LJ04_SCHJA|nr:hypotheticial protein [Schistosoma japonicum]
MIMTMTIIMMMIMKTMRSFNNTKMITLLLTVSLLVISVKGVVIPEASPIDSQSKRWTDFKRAIRWSDYPLGYSPEFRRHYSSYEQRPYFNDLPI